MEEEAIVESKPEPAVESVPVAEKAPTSAEAAEEDDDVDAFDFFTAEPLGSAARDLEKQQEAEAAAEVAAAPAEEVTVAPSEEIAAPPAVHVAAAPIEAVAAETAEEAFAAIVEVAAAPAPAEEAAPEPMETDETEPVVEIMEGAAEATTVESIPEAEVVTASPVASPAASPAAKAPTPA